MRHRIRSWQLMIAGVVLLLAVAVTTAAPPQSLPPHIVVVMADDLNSLMTESMLAAGLLPNIKKYVVDPGVRFGASFVATPLCCPSRATYLTGRYPHNHGVQRNVPPNGSVVSFDDSSTIATWLRASGYRTAHVGKYLNGYGRTADVPATDPRHPTYVPPGWDEWHALVGSSAYHVYNYTINSNGTMTTYGGTATSYQTAVLADLASGVVGAALAVRGRPLFLSVATLAPHFEVFTALAGLIDGAQYPDVWSWSIRPDSRDRFRKPAQWNYIFQTMPFPSQQKASFNEPDVADKPASLQKPLMTDENIAAVTRQYRMAAASMLAVDDLVGAVGRALGSQVSRTVFVFTSDNGYLYGEHRLGGKSAAYEEAIRVPLYIAGPGVVGKRTVNELVLNNDLAPTIAELARATPTSPVDGRSLVPLLQGTAPADWRRRFLVEYLSSANYDVPTYGAVRTGPADLYPSRLYVEYSGTSSPPDAELYDLAVDPAQVESAHADTARAAERVILSEQLGALRTCGPAAIPCASAER